MEGIEGIRARMAQIQATIQSVSPAPVASPAVDSSDGSDFGSVLQTQMTSLDVAGSADGDNDASTATSDATSAAGIDTSHTQWAKDVLTKLGMPVTSENVKAMNAWAQAEGTQARFNPIATTQRMPGTTNFNSVGVKNYSSYEDGVDATVTTLTNGRYANILSALRGGNDAVAVARAVADSPWGTHDGVLRVLGAKS